MARPRPRAQAPITVTRQDHDRLTALIERCGEGPLARLADDLDEELARATVVEQSAIPPDIVTMRSTCTFRFTDTSERREVTLVYPEEADLDNGRVSVLAPIGSALLGLARGKKIRWSTPSGERELQVVDVRYQPEAAGDLDL